MIKILPLDILGVSHRIPWKDKNAVYCLQISALVPEIHACVFEKYMKYANEKTDDVIYSPNIIRSIFIYYHVILFIVAFVLGK